MTFLRVGGDGSVHLLERSGEITLLLQHGAEDDVRGDVLVVER